MTPQAPWFFAWPLDGGDAIRADNREPSVLIAARVTAPVFCGASQTALGEAAGQVGT